MATKKSSKTKKASLPSPKVKTSVAEQAQTNGELRQQLAEALEREKTALKKLQDRDQQLAEALEQQTSTGEILRIIANSAADLQPVLDAVAENAARLIDAQDCYHSSARWRRSSRCGSFRRDSQDSGYDDPFDS
jgi:ABC-type transporter Mla subunit MlaD